MPRTPCWDPVNFQRLYEVKKSCASLFYISGSHWQDILSGHIAGTFLLGLIVGACCRDRTIVCASLCVVVLFNVVGTRFFGLRPECSNDRHCKWLAHLRVGVVRQPFQRKAVKKAVPSTVLSPVLSVHPSILFSLSIFLRPFVCVSVCPPPLSPSLYNSFRSSGDRGGDAKP